MPNSEFSPRGNGLEQEYTQRRAYVAIVRFTNPPETTARIEDLQILLCRVKPPVESEWPDSTTLQHILQLLRNSDFEVWIMPGGKLKNEEMAEPDHEVGARRGVARETREEILAEIHPDKLTLLAVGEIQSFDPQTGEEIMETAHLFMAKDTDIVGEPRPGIEMDLISWMNIEQIAKVKSLDVKRAYAFVAVALFGREVLHEIAPRLGLPDEVR